MTDVAVYAYVLESSSSEVITKLSLERKIESDLARSRYEPEGDSAILGDNGMERRMDIQVNSNPSNFPIPKLELLVFDETKPR